MDEAVEEIKSQSGKQFDPDVVTAFLTVQASGRLASAGDLYELIDLTYG